MKNKLGLIVITILAISVLFSCNLTVKSGEALHSITVEGSGSVTMAADMANIEFAIITSGVSAKAIVSQNETLTERFVDTVKSIGISEDDIAIGECSLSSSDKHEAIRYIIVNVKDLDLVPTVIDCKTNVIHINSIEYKLIDSANAYKAARTAAVEKANDAGSLFANATGTKIGEILFVSENFSDQYTTPDGKIITTSNIIVTFKIQ